MDISIGRGPVNGMAEIEVTVQDERGGFGFKASIMVWVPWNDSVEVMHRSARRETQAFLSRMQSVLGDEDPPE